MPRSSRSVVRRRRQSTARAAAPALYNWTDNPKPNPSGIDFRENPVPPVNIGILGQKGSLKIRSTPPKLTNAGGNAPVWSLFVAKS